IHIPFRWTQNDFINNHLMIFQGEPYYSKPTSDRSWYMVRRDPLTGLYRIGWLSYIKALVQNTGTRYWGDNDQCWHKGGIIRREVCHYLCKGIGNPQIQQGLCIHNACFCEWKIPSTLYESISLSLAVSFHIGTSEEINLGSLLEISERFDSLPDSTTHGLDQLLDEEECEASEPQPSCSR
ncbi:hypothetical protein QAD02_006002, partial [Eretmocerus hayati]